MTGPMGCPALGRCARSSASSWLLHSGTALLTVATYCSLAASGDRFPNLSQADLPTQVGTPVSAECIAGDGHPCHSNAIPELHLSCHSNMLLNSRRERPSIFT